MVQKQHHLVQQFNRNAARGFGAEREPPPPDLPLFINGGVDMEGEVMFDYWDYCESKDIITPILPKLEAREFFIRPDGKIALLSLDTYQSPWVHAKLAEKRKCGRWHRIYFKMYGFIPQRCMSCYKCVQRPRNLKELFEVYEYQKEIEVPSKCGIERRPYVEGNYGAYWYNDSLEEALDRMDLLKKDLPHIPVITKRGCTEFETRFGPSDRWASTALSLELEETLDDIMINVMYHNSATEKVRDGKPSPWYVNDHSKRMWVEFAYDRSDLTYKLYTKGQPLIPRVLTYDRDLDTGCQIEKLTRPLKEGEEGIICS